MTSAKKPSIRRYRKNLSEQSALYTDGSTSYVDLKGYVKSHHSEVIPKDKVGGKTTLGSHYFHQQCQKATVEQLSPCET